MDTKELRECVDQAKAAHRDGSKINAWTAAYWFNATADEIDRLRSRVAEVEAERDAARADVARLTAENEALSLEVAAMQDNAPVRKRDEALAELAALRERVAKAETMLARVVKYCREDRAVTPGFTRLARLCDEIVVILAALNPPPATEQEGKP